MTAIQTFAAAHTQPPVLKCFDDEDVEGWLIEEGIGHRNKYGNLEYGPDLSKESVDIPEFPDSED